MKIINKADGSKWKALVKCKGCLSELEVYGCDLKYTPATSGNGLERGSSDSYTTNCAVCKIEMYIDPTMINDIVKALLKSGLTVAPPKEEVPYRNSSQWDSVEDFYNK